MKSKLGVSAAIVLLVFALSGAVQQTAEQQFQSGIYKEEVEGKLEEAIALFQKVVDGTKDESLAAKALLHIGLCYEKLGNQEATNAYERLIADYPGQRDEVALARKRLAELVKSAERLSKRPTFRRIRTPFNIPLWSGSLLSPDGKTLAFGSGDSLWTVPMPGNVDPDLAGEPTKLAGVADVLGHGLSWSGDGKWIAFSRAYKHIGGTRINFRPEGSHIDVIPSSGGEAKRIKIPQWVATDGKTSQRLSLSPDGKAVVFDAGNQIFVASVDTGEIKQVTDGGSRAPCFSPDGKKIAYITPPVRQANPLSIMSEIWVISADGNDPVKVSGDVNQFLSGGPFWSPDGRMLAFWRVVDAGPNAKSVVCIVPLSEEGKPLRSPIEIETPLFINQYLTGWTPDNKIGLIFMSPYHEYVYTVPVAGGKASQVSPLEGLAGIPRWAPDGKRIFFRWKGGGLGSAPSGGGEVRMHLGLDRYREETGFFTIYPGVGNHVSPDGKSVVFAGGTAKEGPHIYTLPVGGGEPEQVASYGRYPCWSPDGKWIAYQAREKISEEKRVVTIVRVPREGGEVEKVTGESAHVEEGGIDWSPDGKSIAYFSKTGDGPEGTLNLVSIDGGEVGKVCRVQSVDAQSDVSWSPDGQKIAFVSKGKIWVVSANGGEPAEVKTDVDARIGKLDWSPDGTKIAFSGELGGNREFWFMENFLHLIKQ